VTVNSGPLSTPTGPRDASDAWTARFEAALERHLRQGCPHREAAVLAAQEASRVG